MKLSFLPAQFFPSSQPPFKARCAVRVAGLYSIFSSAGLENKQQLANQY